MNMSKTKKLTTIGMLCALAYVAVVVGRIPIVLFLKYDPKDVIIVIGGLIFGPFTALAVTVIVAVAQMFTISGTGFLGCIMNIISSCSFACTASLIYKKRRKLSGAIWGLFGGLGCQVVVMMLWNYLIAPIYMGYPREAIAALLLPAFLPFNLIKGGLNAAITLLLYKPVVVALRRANLIPVGNGADGQQGALAGASTREHVGKVQINIGVAAAALLIIVACVLLILSLNHII